ncbi:MAG: porin [Ferruginibacter sp.]
MSRCLMCLLFFTVSCKGARCQFLMDMVDTTTEIGNGIFSIYKRFDHIRIGGYIQPQFQAATSKGAKSYEGGDFVPNVNNRFTLRRGRIRFDYVHFSEKRGPSVQVVFQFDGTERGVFIRDFWGRIFENKYELFSLSAGMFARPFGFETNLSSGDRESPERGRMNQLLMKTERDLGMMVSFEPRKKDHPLRHLKIDAGLFNGQGLAATTDFDSHKDFITRVGLKTLNISNGITLSVASSYLDGGFLQNTKYLFTTKTAVNGKFFIIDSSSKNKGAIAPRKYYGMDMQLKIKKREGYAEFRAEVIAGKQTSTLQSSETPAALLTGNEGYYTRNFNGAYFYFLYNIFNTHHLLVAKYDWYDPNSAVNTNDIGKTGTNMNATDIKYSTLGLGYINYLGDNLKLVLWYSKVMNEKTKLTGYTGDLKDDVFTCRLQFRF